MIKKNVIFKLISIILFLFVYVEILTADNIDIEGIKILYPVYKSFIETCSETTSQNNYLIIIGEVQKEQNIFYNEKDKKKGEPAGYIVPIKIEKILFGKSNEKTIYIILFNPIDQLVGFGKEGSKVLLFIQKLKGDFFKDEISRIKDLSNQEYYYLRFIPYGVFDLSEKSNESFVKHIEIFMEVINIENETIKIEKLSEMLQNAQKYDEEIIVLQIANIHSPKAIPVLKKYIDRNISNKEKEYLINSIIYNIGKIKSKEVIDFAMELITNEKSYSLGERLLNSIELKNKEMKKYCYEMLDKQNLKNKQDIFLKIIGKQNIGLKEINILKEILLNDNSAVENRLLSAELMSKVWDKNLYPRVIELFELAKRDKNEIISKKMMEYVSVLNKSILDGK
ncbi:MAG: hypothetical protein V1752_03300 [Candidatus Firestonebacteria bacterium]